MEAEGPKRQPEGGVNGSQSKFLRGIWPISQNQPKIHSTKSRRAAQQKIDNRTHAVMPLGEKPIFKRRAHDYRNQEETIKLIASYSARRKNNVRTPRTEDGPRRIKTKNQRWLIWVGKSDQEPTTGTLCETEKRRACDVGKKAVSKSKNRGRAVARLEWNEDSDNAHPHRRRQDTASRCARKTPEERQREGRKTLLWRKTLENWRRGSPGGANLCTAHAITATSSSRERDTHGAPSVERCRNSELRRHANKKKTSAERCRRKTEAASVPR
jgi:hypothetical protein